MQTENYAFDEAVRQCHRLQAAHAAMTKDTTEEEGVYYALVDALAAAVSCPVSTASDLLAKLDLSDQFRAASSVYVAHAAELEIGRASGRERVVQVQVRPGGARNLKKQKK